MRLLLGLLAIALLGTGATGCGDSEKGAGATLQSSSSSARLASSYSKSDGDKDNDDELHGNIGAENDDRALLSTYGSDVSEADKQLITALVKSYYAAVAAEDGTKACALLDSSLAKGVVEDHGKSTNGGGKICASIVSLLAKQQHTQLIADEVATMGVTNVRANGNLGLAVLGFKRMPEGEILIEREGGVWKVDSLLDSEMP